MAADGRRWSPNSAVATWRWRSAGSGSDRFGEPWRRAGRWLAVGDLVAACWWALAAEPGLGRWPRRGDLGWFTGQAEAREDLADRLGIEAGGEQVPRALAVGAGQDIDAEDPAQQLGPAVVARVGLVAA